MAVELLARKASETSNEDGLGMRRRSDGLGKLLNRLQLCVLSGTELSLLDFSSTFAGSKSIDASG